MTHSRGSILLVDDEEKILKSIGRALREAGHAVVDTASPRQAQRLLAERPFDVLLVDNMMPELSGLDLIREYVGTTAENERAHARSVHAEVEDEQERPLHHDHDRRAGRVARHRQQRCPAPVGQRATDDEQDARPGDDHEDDPGEGEGQQRSGGRHGRTLAVDRLPP